MDFHTEQLVKKKRVNSDYLAAVLLAAGTMIIWLITFRVLGILTSILSPVILQLIHWIAAAIVVGSLWGAWKLLQNFNIEYEYELTNHYLDIDKIMGQASRKRLVSIDFKEIDRCGYVSEAEFKNTDGITKTYDYSGNPDADGRVYVDYKPDGSENKIRVIFRPNDKLKDYLNQAAPRKVKL